MKKKIKKQSFTEMSTRVLFDASIFYAEIKGIRESNLQLNQRHTLGRNKLSRGVVTF